MELAMASAIAILTATGVYLLLRARSFDVILRLTLLSYATNLLIFSGGRLLPAPENRLGRILVRARGADGTLLNASAQGYSSSHNGRTVSMMLEYEFDLAAIGQSFDLDLFLVEPLSVDFTIAAPAR